METRETFPTTAGSGQTQGRPRVTRASRGFSLSLLSVGLTEAPGSDCSPRKSSATPPWDDVHPSKAKPPARALLYISTQPSWAKILMLLHLCTTALTLVHLPTCPRLG